MAVGDTLEDALKVKAQADLLLSGGFPLSKWAGSHDALRSTGQHNDHPKLFVEAGRVTAFGIIWYQDSDDLILRVSEGSAGYRTPTKRTVLFYIARTFDPAGWIAPVLVAAKILLQDIWKEDLAWNQELPDPVLRTVRNCR